MQGCGGDANPCSEEIARIHGMTLGKEVLRVLDTKLTPVRGPLTTIVAPVAIPLKQEFSQEDFDKLKDSTGNLQAVGRKLKAKLDAGEKLQSHFESKISVWQFGQDLTFVALPGEVVAEYVRLIEDAVGPRKLWISVCNHDVFGYLPTARILREGGWESKGIGNGIFAPKAEKVFVDQVRSLTEKACK